jgi:ataxia telangiectasia mutated family protein
MGISGVEGTFRKCSEEVLRVLRARTLQLLTILEVVIHDPLYKWSLSPLQARKRQLQGADGEGEGGEDIRDPQLPVVVVASHNNGQPTLPGTGGVSAGVRNGTGIGGEREREKEREGGNFSRDAAERTLQRIRNKLQGFEDTSGGGLSVQGQVELLISEARSVENLSKLFPGWSPWM